MAEDSGSSPLGPRTRIHHYAISVADLDGMTRWYEEKLGGVVVDGWDALDEFGARFRFVDINGLTLELIDFNGSRKSSRQFHEPTVQATVQGPIHLAFAVDDCEAVAAELKSRGVQFAWDVNYFPELKLKAAYFYDLEGNNLEIVEADR